MSKTNNRIFGAAEVFLLVLLLLQAALVVLFVAPQFNGKLAVMLIDNNQYTAAAKLITGQDIKNSEELSTWIDGHLSDELNAAANAGGERSQKVMELVRVLDSKGYDCAAEMRSAFVQQIDQKNYMDNGGVSAVSLLNVMSRSDEYYDLTELVSEAASYEQGVLLEKINAYRKENGSPALKQNDSIDSACSELAVFILENIDDLNGESFRSEFQELRKDKNTALSQDVIPIRSYNFISYINSESTGLYISKAGDVFDSFSTEQLVTLVKDHDYIGIGTAYDPDSESFVWYIETIDLAE